MLKALWFCGHQARPGGDDLELPSSGLLGLTALICSSVLSQCFVGQRDFGIHCLCDKVLGLGGGGRGAEVRQSGEDAAPCKKEGPSHHERCSVVACHVPEVA